MDPAGDSDALYRYRIFRTARASQRRVRAARVTAGPAAARGKRSVNSAIGDSRTPGRRASLPASTGQVSVTTTVKIERATLTRAVRPSPAGRTPRCTQRGSQASGRDPSHVTGGLRAEEAAAERTHRLWIRRASVAVVLGQGLA